MAKKSPKLLFTDEERQAPELKRTVKKADKSIEKLEKAEAKIPKKRVKKKQRTVDKKTGKVKTKILFEEVDKKRPSSNLKSEIKSVPVTAVAGTAVNVLRDGEDNSNSASTVHGIEKTAETSVRIKYDPYVLISALTALHQGAWELSDVEDYMNDLFSRQYTLTETVRTERRTRTVNNGDCTVSEEEYDYRICTVKLVNNNLSHIPSEILTQDQLELYATYMKTLGNRPDLFGDSVYVDKYINSDYEDYAIPPDALSDVKFAAMMNEAKKYLGFPYVWGGSSPATSFDCSGFVCWVVNHSGWNVGRTTAEGLRQKCIRVSPSNAKPGDLIFFEHTYNTPGASHVGIYVGDGKMIHCGDPIQYANVNSSYFSSHFMQYGRLP